MFAHQKFENFACYGDFVITFVKYFYHFIYLIEVEQNWKLNASLRYIIGTDWKRDFLLWVGGITQYTNPDYLVIRFPLIIFHPWSLKTLLWYHHNQVIYFSSDDCSSTSEISIPNWEWVFIAISAALIWTWSISWSILHDNTRYSIKLGWKYSSK